jgi:hypothetical protein
MSEKMQQKKVAPKQLAMETARTKYGRAVSAWRRHAIEPHMKHQRGSRTGSLTHTRLTSPYPRQLSQDIAIQPTERCVELQPDRPIVQPSETGSYAVDCVRLEVQARVSIELLRQSN